MARIKTISRVLRKANADYAGSVVHVMDVLHSTVVVESVDAAYAAGELIRAELSVANTGDKERFKDRITNPTPAGHMNILTNVVLPSRIIAEIQVNHPRMQAAKDQAHSLYAQQQEAEGRGDMEEADRLLAEQRSIYVPAGEEFLAARSDIDLTEASTRLRQSLSSIGSGRDPETLSVGRSSPPNAENRPSPGMATMGAPSESKNRVPSGKTSGMGRGSDMDATSTENLQPSTQDDKGTEGDGFDMF
ncbi:MAG: hypothetical protein Q9Q40_00005, partial [Acidobacteriota bacterium]|nr:hypothetical protein [Acidobacteriota bacterium]